MTIRDLLGKTVRAAFQFNYLPDGTAEDQVEVDATISEQHGRTATLTQSPIEGGGSMTDHRKVEPVRIQISGILANIEFSALSAITDPQGAFLAGTRAADNWTKLVDLFEAIKSDDISGEPDPKAGLFDLLTETKVYKSMTMTSLVMNKSQSSGDAIYFEATAVEVMFADSETVALTVEDTGPAPSEPPKGDEVSQGAKATPTVPDPVSDLGTRAVGVWESGVKWGKDLTGGAIDALTGGAF